RRRRERAFKRRAEDGEERRSLVIAQYVGRRPKLCERIVFQRRFPLRLRFLRIREQDLPFRLLRHAIHDERRPPDDVKLEFALIDLENLNRRRLGLLWYLCHPHSLRLRDPHLQPGRAVPWPFAASQSTSVMPCLV